VNAARLFKFRPITVEARHVNAADWDSVEEIAAWCGGEALDIADYLDDPGSAVLFILDEEDESVGSYADDGDWVVKNPGGSFDVYSPEAFAATFAPLVEL